MSQLGTGGDNRDRTGDLRLAKPALSQLSYIPEPRKMVGLDRFELSTSRLSGVRSNQLSYRPLGQSPVRLQDDRIAREPIMMILDCVYQVPPSVRRPAEGP